FFQAEDGIRDRNVTGVQTCALPILQAMAERVEGSFVFTVLDSEDSIWFVVGDNPLCLFYYDGLLIYASTEEILIKTVKKLRLGRSEERRVGKECRGGGWRYGVQKKQ